ncbi:MAG: MaoC family dehydratase [Nitrospirae bacterium]|nr:MaoC family dehydratase [Nitrospirota bacterium]
MLERKRYEDLKVGDRATLTRTITETDIVLFAGLTGDYYPVHVDEEYARRSRFGGRIAHGMLVGSLVSTLNGWILGTGGGISLRQTLEFRKPVRPGDTITAVAEITELIPEKRQLRVKHTLTNQRGEVVVTGEALEMKDEEEAP